MDNDMKLLYDSIITLTKDVKSMKQDINEVIDELNVKIARLETQMDIVLDNRDNYNNLNNKVHIMNTKINELSKYSNNNKALFQSIMVGIIVFIASYLIKFIH